MSHKQEALFAGYIPVIHEGYVRAFENHPGIPVGVFDKTITDEFDYLRKDIRALKPEQAVAAIRGLGSTAFTLSKEALTTQLQTEGAIVMPDDDISRALFDQTPNKLARVYFEPVFLRWDRKNTDINSDVQPDRVIQLKDLDVDLTIIDELRLEATLSSDWWRHIAAGLIKDEQLILTHNRAMPHEYTNFIDGDPRITENRGEKIDKSLFIHAEADLIAFMAREGKSTKDQDLFVTTFPCPNCARLIAASGFKRCYFMEGYAMLDGQRILNDADVEIIKIEIDDAQQTPEARLRPYPEKKSSR